MPTSLSPWTPWIATLTLLLVVQVLARGALRSLAVAGGWTAVPWLTGWLGVPVHELSHAAVCVLLRRPVTEMRLFAPDPATGTLGYVKWQPGSGPLAWLAPLLVGLAPLAGATLALQGLLWLGGHWTHIDARPVTDAPPMTHWLAAMQASGEQALAISKVLWRAGGWHQVAAVGFWYAAAAIAAHGVPSREDMAGAWKGLLVLCVVLGSAWGACRVAKVALTPWLQTAGVSLAAAVVPALALGAVALIGLWLLATLVRLLRG